MSFNADKFYFFFVKGSDHRIHFWCMSKVKTKPLNVLKNVELFEKSRTL